MNRDFILPNGAFSGGGVLVPPMSSTSQDGFEISSVPASSDNYTGVHLYNAFNGDYTSQNFNAAGNPNYCVWVNTESVTVKVKLKSSKKLDLVVTVNPPVVVSGASGANLIGLQGSNDDLSYDDILYSNTGATPVQVTSVKGSVKKYKFYKLTYGKLNGFIGVNEIALIGG